MARATLDKADAEPGTSATDILYGGHVAEQRNQALADREQRLRLRNNYSRRLKRAEQIREKRRSGLQLNVFASMLEGSKEGKQALREYGLKASQLQRWFDERRHWYAQFPKHSPVSLAFLRCLEEMYPPDSKIIFTQESFKYSGETATLKGFKLSCVDYDQVSLRLEWDYYTSYDEVTVDNFYLIEVPEDQLYPLPDPPQGLNLNQDNDESL